jgi:hypothetical protein
MVNRRHFLKQTSTAAFAAAVLPLISALPVAAEARASAPLINQMDPSPLDALLADPETQQTIKFLIEGMATTLEDADG